MLKIYCKLVDVGNSYTLMRLPPFPNRKDPYAMESAKRNIIAMTLMYAGAPE